MFNKDYNSGNVDDLPGVEKDETELTELLSEYRQEIVRNCDVVLEDLKAIVKEEKEEQFERVHFHFSGNCGRNINLVGFVY